MGQRPIMNQSKRLCQTNRRLIRTSSSPDTVKNSHGISANVRKADEIKLVIPGGIVRERVLWHCLFHLVNHGTQHRSEAAALLTGYGQSPGGLDFTALLNEHFNLPS